MKQLLLTAAVSFVALASMSPDAGLTTIAAKAAANYKARESLSADYTYTESFRNWNYNSKGKTTMDVSDTFNVIFLEGVAYFRRIEHNGKPLSASEEKREQKKAEDVGKARRSGDRNAGAYPHAITLRLPVEELPVAFDLASASDVLLDGRKAFVIEATPSATYKAVTGRDQLAGVVRMTVWVDRHDLQIIKIRAEVVKSGTRYQPGTIIESDYTKARDEVWLLSRFHFKGTVNDGSGNVSAEAEQKCYDYRKFVTDSKVVQE